MILTFIHFTFSNNGRVVVTKTIGVDEPVKEVEPVLNDLIKQQLLKWNDALIVPEELYDSVSVNVECAVGVKYNQ